MASKFRTTELSNPEFESSHLRFITVKTPNLKGRGDICVFVPPIKDLKDIPIVTLLHGVYGSAWIWAHKAGVHFTALKMMESGVLEPMIIAMPSDGLWGDGSAYLPHHEKDFDKWIVDDVPNAIIENITGASTNSSLFIGGLSMGGFGALSIGARFPERYKAISGHSSITKFEQMAQFIEEPIAEYHIPKELQNVIDSYKMNRLDLPAIRFDCGIDDSLIHANRLLHKELLALDIIHTYQEFEGGHEWPYWQKHIEKTLLFFNDYM